MAEELSLDFETEKFQYLFRLSPLKNKGIGFIYLVVCDDANIVIDNDEVIDVKCVSLNELRSYVKSDEFVTYGDIKINTEKYYQKLFKILSKHVKE